MDERDKMFDTLHTSSKTEFKIRFLFFSLGQRECKDVCAGPVICGRNAVCEASSHRPLCTCPDGYFGNPEDDKIGCQKKLCTTNSDCPDEVRQ